MTSDHHTIYIDNRGGPYNLYKVTPSETSQYFRENIALFVPGSKIVVPEDPCKHFNREKGLYHQNFTVVVQSHAMRAESFNVLKNDFNDVTDPSFLQLMSEIYYNTFKDNIDWSLHAAFLKEIILPTQHTQFDRLGFIPKKSAKHLEFQPPET